MTLKRAVATQRYLDMVLFFAQQGYYFLPRHRFEGYMLYKYSKLLTAVEDLQESQCYGSGSSVGHCVCTYHEEQPPDSSTALELVPLNSVDYNVT